jgi:hypothetical protein
MATSPLTVTRLRRIAPTLLVVVAFSWIFFLPVSHAEILYPLMGLLGVSAAWAVWKRNPEIDPHVWAVAFIVVGLGIYGNVLGITNTFPVATFAVYIVTPVMFLVCAVVATTAALRSFMIAAVIGTVLVSVILLVFIAGEAGVIHQLVPSWVITNLDLRATFRDGGSQARSWGLSSLNGLGPIWVASLFVGRHALLPPWWLRFTCAALALATAILSARDSITLVMLLAPAVALLLRVTLLRTRRTPLWLPSRPWQWIAIGAALVLAAVLVIPRIVNSGPIASVLSAIGSFFGVTSASGDANQSIRSDEASYLLNGWSMNPIFGAGFRSVAPGYLRASEIPWSLELQYHVLLFSVGLVGVAIALSAVVAGVLFVRKAVRTSPEYMPILLVSMTGAIAMLIANATNPYLVAPAHQWAVFLPLAVATVAVNAAATQREPAVGSPNAVEGRIVR